MEIEIPKYILELAEKEGYEVIDVRVPEEGDKYVTPLASTITTLISNHSLSGACYIVKKKEWVPKKDENFYYAASKGRVTDTIYQPLSLETREEFIQAGNYFKKAEQAKAANKALPEFFAKFRD